MRRAPRSISPYRRPQPLEESWQCPVSGQLFVDNPDPFEPDDAGPQRPVKRRCPCHHRLMRRTTASWYGFPGWLGRVAFGGSALLGLWTLFNVLTAMRDLRLLLG